MRILITGAGGQVGRDLQAVLAGVIPAGGAATALLGTAPVAADEFDVVAADRSRLDVTDRAAVSSFVERCSPDVIVHLAAYTAVDRAEVDPEGARLGNQVATANVADAADAAGAHLIAISTDYVFAGDQGRALDENDATNPLSVYGATKLAGERACAPGVTIVRTSWVAGAAGRTVLNLAVEAAASGRELAFVDDQVGSLTNAADLAAGLVFFIRNRPGGVVHMAGTGHASWFEVIAHAVEAAGGSRDQVRAISTAQLDPQPAAQRPAFSPLVSARRGELGFEPLPEWQDGVSRLVGALASKGTR
jgi:dTDP-4-dehydrorhamnose reductase